MTKLPIDYSKGVIYKIVCKNPEIKECYVGSTTDLRRRKNRHKTTCNNPNDVIHHNLYVYQFIRENGGWDNWEVIEIEKYPAVDGDDLRRQERHYLEQLNATLNRCKPMRSEIEKKEYHQQYREQHRNENIEYSNNYYQKNKEILKEKQREYHEKNKEKINEKYVCACGGRYIFQNKNRHLKSKKHLKFSQSQV